MIIYYVQAASDIVLSVYYTVYLVYVFIILEGFYKINTVIGHRDILSFMNTLTLNLIDLFRGCESYLFW